VVEFSENGYMADALGSPAAAAAATAAEFSEYASMVDFSV
jgi:hypothetical protein